MNLKSSIAEISKRMMYLVNENQLSQYDAWNGSSVQLIKISKVYIHIYIINCYLANVLQNNCPTNQNALNELLEHYLLYGICDTFSASILKVMLTLVNKILES